MNISEESFDLLRVDRVAETRARTSRLLRVALWGGLLGFGLKRRGAVGLVAMAVSFERLYRMFQQGSLRRLPLLPRGGRAVPGGDPGGWDRVDEALWETFPASDPPGHMAR